VWVRGSSGSGTLAVAGPRGGLHPVPCNPTDPTRPRPAPRTRPNQAEEVSGSDMAPPIAILWGITIMFVGGLAMVLALLFSIPVGLGGGVLQGARGGTAVGRVRGAARALGQSVGSGARARPRPARGTLSRPSRLLLPALRAFLPHTHALPPAQSIDRALSEDSESGGKPIPQILYDVFNDRYGNPRVGVALQIIPIVCVFFCLVATTTYVAR
jgi:hypothetical protein